MSFNPLAEKGIPLDQQYRNWRELNVLPLDPEPPDRYTMTRVIALNAIEIESIGFKHAFFRRCSNDDVRRTLAEIRYLENQQQRVVNWLVPGVASVLETTLGYEQNAVDLTAWVARMEPIPTSNRRTSSECWRTSTTSTGTPTSTSSSSTGRPRRSSTVSPR